GVATLDDVTVPGGQLRLERDHLRRVVGQVGEGEHAADVGGVPVADLGVTVLAIVRLVGQPETALRDVHQVPLGVLRIGVDVVRKRTRHAGALQPAQYCRERGAVGSAGDRPEFLADRIETGGLDRRGVHERGVQVADLLGVGARLGAGRRGLFDDGPHVDLGLVGERAEGSVERAVGGDLVFGEPSAVHVFEEVVLGADPFVDVSEIDAGANLRVLREGHAPHPYTGWAGRAVTRGPDRRGSGRTPSGAFTYS